VSHLQAIGWLDPLLVLSRLRQVYWERFEGDGDLDFIHLLDEDGSKLPIMRGEKGWQGANTFLTRFKQAAAPFLGGHPATLGATWIERLRPNGKTPWTVIDEPDWLRIHVCLAGPPGAWLYCGGESVNGTLLMPGAVMYINTAALHSAVNFGNAPRIHLVANVRRPNQNALPDPDEDA
jgi:hypothetical protein